MAALAVLTSESEPFARQRPGRLGPAGPQTSRASVNREQRAERPGARRVVDSDGFVEQRQPLGEAALLRVHVAQDAGDLREPDGELALAADGQRPLQQRPRGVQLALETVQVRQAVGRRHDAVGILARLGEAERGAPVLEPVGESAALGEWERQPGGRHHQRGGRAQPIPLGGVGQHPDVLAVGGFRVAILREQVAGEPPVVVGHGLQRPIVEGHGHLASVVGETTRGRGIARDPARHAHGRRRPRQLTAVVQHGGQALGLVQAASDSLELRQRPQRAAQPDLKLERLLEHLGRLRQA